MPRSPSPRAILIALLTPVVLAACSSGSQSDCSAVQSQNQQLRQQVASQQVQIDRLRGAIEYTVESDLLFPSGGYQISPAGRQLISKFARRLAPTQEEKIVVTGYTDNARIGPVLAQQGHQLEPNPIGEANASKMMQYMVSQGVNPNLVAAQGKGEADPVATNDTPAGRAQNRRVDLTLVAAAAAPAQASATVGTVQFSGGSVAAGIGFSWGSGTLTYNGQTHHFKITGLALLGVGISSVDASGDVSGLNNLADFNGTYSLGTAGAAVGVGGSVATLQNEHGVVMNISATKIGLHFQLGAGGATVTLID